jgi:hypothetical protein
MKAKRWLWIGALFVAVLVLNVLGVLRYPGGPLREPSADGPLWLDIRPADQGSSLVSNSQPSDWAIAGRSYYYGQLAIRNETALSAVIEAVTPIDPTPELVVEAIYIQRPGAPRGEVTAFGPTGAFPDASSLEQDFVRLPVSIPGNADSPEDAARVLVVLSSKSPGAFGFSALALDYRLGPLAFRTIHHLALAGCLGPLLPGEACPDPD